ncbi:hypothetical protein GF1_29330 [Desulfolithobacter dissulfuricans]|uniref:Uncharacterized protein n=1 Tax=Desulfolithobacter dissulfuricans TaxID=2795293 RepID=A0A915XKW6_9BACT|nr:hypothetical protein [Desulfolithobacter dissulfuricans]BCO10557.1 hypothetical protein GF1_29330 [Desulfolithobacter dissulfuricans]
MPRPVNLSRKMASFRDIASHHLFRQLLVVILVFSLFSAIGSIARAHTAQFEAWIGSLGLTGMLVFLAAMTVLPLIGVTQTLFAFVGGPCTASCPG